MTETKYPKDGNCDCPAPLGVRCHLECSQYRPKPPTSENQPKTK